MLAFTALREQRTAQLGQRGGTMFPDYLSGSDFPHSLVLRVHLPGTKSFFFASPGSVPRQEGAAGSAIPLCPAPSDLHSEQRSQSRTAQKNSFLGTATAWTPAGEGAREQSHRQESLLPSASPSPLHQKSKFLVFNPSERSHGPFASKQPPVV